MKVVKTALLATLVATAVAAAWWIWPNTPLDDGVRADRVLILKRARELRLEKNGRILKSYRIALGASPEGHKTQQGDERTPEGNYTVDWRNNRSRFHLSLHISYPNRQDRQQARKRGVSPGGDIMIHGAPNGYGWIGALHSVFDWTDGCIAVTDGEIEEIWNAVPTGTPVELRP